MTFSSLKCFLCFKWHSPMVFDVEGGSSTWSLHGHRIGLGLESSLLQDGVGASHDTAKRTSPIVAQPAWLQFCENDHGNYGLDSQGVARDQKRTSLGVNHVQLRDWAMKRNLLPHSGRASEWRGVKTPSPWMHGGVKSDPQHDNKSSLYWQRDTASRSSCKKILTNPRFEQKLCILFACFLQENMRFVKFYAILGQKSEID